MDPRSHLIQNFRLQISIKDSHLHLHAEHIQDKRHFHLQLDSDSIAQITNALFSDIHFMAQGLTDAAKSTYPGLKLSLENNGKLTYSALISVGALHKEFAFSLNLIEEDPVEPVVLLQKKVETLTNELEELRAENAKMKSEYGEKIEKLERIVFRLEQKMADNNRNSQLEKNNQVFGEQICFNRESKNASHYEFSKDGKTIKCIKDLEYHFCLECVPEIRKAGKHSYSLKVNKITSKICFGISSQIRGDNWNGNHGCYRYLIGDGRIGIEGVSLQRNPMAPIGDSGSVVKMVVDMDKGLLVFYVDEIEVQSCKIKGKVEYSLYVSLQLSGDSVTLL